MPVLLFLLFTWLPTMAMAQDCGEATPCEIAHGDYHMAVPPEWDGESKLPAVIFFHGHRGSAAQVIRNKGLVGRMHARGYAVIAPNGEPRTGRDGKIVRGWPGRVGSPERRDELAYMLDLMSDVENRRPIDWSKSLITGFSSGGSMAWFVACHLGDRFGGFAPVAGALRHPRMDQGCQSGPVRLLHIHGFTDSQVPIEGRAIGSWHQGDVFESMSLARQTNDCRTQPDSFEMGERFRCRLWTSCESGRDLRLCIHDGGHGMPQGWADLALDWFEG